jgi:hypothetical protein
MSRPSRKKVSTVVHRLSTDEVTANAQSNSRMAQRGKASKRE